MTDSRGQEKIHKGDQVAVGEARDLSSQRFIIYYYNNNKLLLFIIKHGSLQHKT